MPAITPCRYLCDDWFEQLIELRPLVSLLGAFSLPELLLCVGMTWKPPTDTFNVGWPKTDVFAPSGGWETEAAAISPWATGAIQKPPEKVLQAYQTDEALKKSYGIELAKANNPFEAACKLFIDDADTSKALWISFHWLNDAIVIASRDVYLKTLAENAKPLDREQLAAKVLSLSEEKILKNGVYIPTIEAKDRIAALKLYSDILGYTGKVEIDNSVTNNTLNEMTIKLVKPEPSKPSVVIDNAPNAKFNLKSQMKTLYQLV
jgi:hypothetical protein